MTALLWTAWALCILTLAGIILDALTHAAADWIAAHDPETP